MLIVILGGSAACDVISGVDEIDFTRAPGEGDGGEGDGGAAGGGAAGGGAAGGGAYDISCGDGNVAVGIHGRSGAWLDSLGLICAPLGHDDTLGPTPFRSEAAGGEGGFPGEATCPPDQVVVGFTIWSDASLTYRVDPHCQTVAQWRVSSENHVSVPGLGSEHGQRSTLICPPDVFADNIFGEAGDYVYTMSFFCHAK